MEWLISQILSTTLILALNRQCNQVANHSLWYLMAPPNRTQMMKITIIGPLHVHTRTKYFTTLHRNRIELMEALKPKGCIPFLTNKRCMQKVEMVGNGFTTRRTSQQVEPRNVRRQAAIRSDLRSIREAILSQLPCSEAPTIVDIRMSFKSRTTIKIVI